MATVWPRESAEVATLEAVPEEFEDIRITYPAPLEIGSSDMTWYSGLGGGPYV